MGLQARMSENDPRLYNSYRDVAHNFGDVVREVAGRLEDERWPALAEYLKSKGITEDELGEACKSLCVFVQAPPVKGETMQSSLEAAGWWKLKEPAQVAVCSLIGTVIMGMAWAGIREATMGGKGPAMNYQDLRDRGSQCAKLISTPLWRRRLDGVVKWFKGIWAALRGTKAPTA